MRKDILLSGLALLGGGLGFGLRLWQRAQGYDPDTQLFAYGHPAALLLLALSAALVLLLPLFLRDLKAPAEPAAAFRCPTSGYMTAMAAAGLLFLISGALGLLEGLGQLSVQLALWRTDPTAGLMLTPPVTQVLCALLALAAGPATLKLGKSAYRDDFPPRCALLVLFPPLTALAWLFATHMDHSTDPILMNYGFLLAAVALLMLAHYYTAATFHDRPRPRLTAICALLGSAFGLIALADRPSPFRMALMAAFLLSALSNTYALLRNSYGPDWPRQPREEQTPHDLQNDADSGDEI